MRDPLRSSSRCVAPHQPTPEATLTDTTDQDSPDGFTWFTPARLAAFEGNTKLKAGQLAQAHRTLTAALSALADDEGKQRTVLLGDLAAVEAARKRPQGGMWLRRASHGSARHHLVRHRDGSHPRRTTRAAILDPY